MDYKVTLIVYVALILTILSCYGFYNSNLIHSAVKHYGWDAIVLFGLIILILFSVIVFNLPS